VLHLDGEQPHHLHRDTGCARDADRGVVVDDEDLVHVTLGDQVAGRRPAVPCDEYATAERGRHDGRAVPAHHRLGSGWHAVRAVTG
jgi:hypothetical protein